MTGVGSKLTLKYYSNRVTKQESILIRKFELDHKFETQGHILIEFNFVKMRTCQFVNKAFKNMKLVKFNMMIIKDW